MINNPDRIRFALPGKGRLKDPSIELLKASGFTFRARGRNLYATCTNEEIVFIFVRTDDIPVLVNSGVVDIGITGSDLVKERNVDIEPILSLGFGKCRLCLAVKDSFAEGDLSLFKDKTIATSFPGITNDFFKRNNVKIKCIEMNGSVEIMVALGLADAIVDIVETGDSLRDNNLKIFKEIENYETQLVANCEIAADPRIRQIKRRIEGILVARRYSILEYNIKKDKLKEAEEITPGYEAPTISELDEEGWAAVKVMVEKKSAVKVMDRLEAIGATAIFETDLKNCRL